MILLLAEALLALALLVFIVWWTMSGKRRDDEPDDAGADPDVGIRADAPADAARGGERPPADDGR